ncbi:hypothetical protein C7M84_007776 [Penaeus vannamei]|uniref:Uncharacterized protein n=1 Tax=Penaeus vannamei TaxID=6689 RepID=A0A423TBE0_PENVA|nr:hypothetical protein C7M84_007776 [Penaeus vannamei]
MAAAEAESTGCCSVSSLRTSTIVLGSIGLVLWPIAITSTTLLIFGELGHYSNPILVMMAAIILIGVNIAYIYQTCLIIFTLTESKRMSRGIVNSVRSHTARLLTFLLVGIAEWVTSVVFYVMEGKDRLQHIPLIGCSFSFVWTVVVVAVAGSLTVVAKRNGGWDMPRDEIPLVEATPVYGQVLPRTSRH